MTPDLATDALPLPEKQIPSTAGMTTKVVKGSIWTLAGSVAPLAVSFVSTPFIIRFLGAEAYGVLLLVGLIPMYFSFADFGMGVASTKFTAEAYAQGNEKKEVEFVWTATAIATVSALIIAVPLFLFSYAIVRALNVPEQLLSQASIALKLASGSFFLGILSMVLNSPMLARLRMDLNTLTQAMPKLLLAAVTPFILYFGYGIVGAVSWAFIVSLCTLGGVVYISGHLLQGVLKPVFNRDLVRPLLKFGAGWFIAMAAAMALANLEKFFLTKLVSVKALAYYSVAFTFANMAMIFTAAMIQSLVPAFSQLQAPGKKAAFDALFSRSLRLNIILLLPFVTIMFAVAEPFFTLWAGEDFGRESTLPFYILLIGLFFHVLAFIPHTSITATGRTDIFAKLYWIELGIYAALAWVLIGQFGIIGGAVAWSIRVLLDAFIVIAISKKVADTRFRFLEHRKVLAFGVMILTAPIATVFFFGPFSVFLIPVTSVALGLYSLIIWNKLINTDEKVWLKERLVRMVR